MYAIRSYYAMLTVMLFSLLRTRNSSSEYLRITSYNVCYTKLLRVRISKRRIIQTLLETTIQSTFAICAVGGLIATRACLIMDDYLCPICKTPIEVIVRCFSEEPFIDGRTYPEICFTCANVPKTWEYDKDGEIVMFGGRRADKLSTPEDMMSDGWTREEAECSIKSYNFV